MEFFLERYAIRVHFSPRTPLEAREKKNGAPFEGAPSKEMVLIKRLADGAFDSAGHFFHVVRFVAALTSEVEEEC